MLELFFPAAAAGGKNEATNGVCFPACSQAEQGIWRQMDRGRQGNFEEKFVVEICWESRVFSGQGHAGRDAGAREIL